MRLNLKKKIDFSKFILKNEYTPIERFQTSTQLLIWQKQNSFQLVTATIYAVLRVFFEFLTGFKNHLIKKK